MASAKRGSCVLKDKNTKLIVMIGAALAVLNIGAIALILNAVSDDTADEGVASSSANITAEQQLNLDAVSELEDIDTSAFTEEELFEHYTTQGSLLMGAEDYLAAAAAYQLAADVNQNDATSYIAQAEAYIGAGDADKAVAAYEQARATYEASGADGVEAFTAFIQTQIDGVGESIQSGMPIFDGRSIDDDAGIGELPAETDSEEDI